jgi:hypothetical protein
MTPHKEFADLGSVMQRVENPEALLVDIWGFWDEMRHRSNNGYFRYREAVGLSYKHDTKDDSYREAV